jgi:hypothetical protein
VVDFCVWIEDDIRDPPPFRPNVTMKTKKSSNTRICADRKPIEERVGPEKTVFQEEKL